MPSKANVDPNYGCTYFSRVPRQNVPTRVVQNDGHIWLLNSVENGLRIIPFAVHDSDVLAELWTSYTDVRRHSPTSTPRGEARVCEERDMDLLADPFLRG